MINFIKKSIILHKEEFIYFPLVPIFMFAIGHLILWLVMIFDKSEDLTSFEMGTIMALMGLFFVSLFGSMGYTNSFNYALSMSQKRSNIVTGLAAVSAIKVTITIAILFLLNIVERYVCKTAFAEYPMESNIAVIFKPHIIITIICAYVAFETLFGALYTKFGIKYFWIVWIAFVLLMQIPGKLADSIVDNKSHFFYKIIDVLVSFNQIALFGIISAVMLVIISLPYVILKKQRVTL